MQSRHVFFYFPKDGIMDIFRKLVWFIQLLNLKYKHKIISMRRHYNFLKKKKEKRKHYFVQCTRTPKIQLNSTCSKGIYKQNKTKTKHEMWCRCHQGTCKTGKISNTVIWNRSWIKHQEKGKPPLLISLFGEGSVSKQYPVLYLLQISSWFWTLNISTRILQCPHFSRVLYMVALFNPNSICSF